MTRSISSGISPVGVFLDNAIDIVFASFFLKDLVDRSSAGLTSACTFGISLCSLVA
jgi:hypothetical protein